MASTRWRFLRSLALGGLLTLTPAMALLGTPTPARAQNQAAPEKKDTLAPGDRVTILFRSGSIVEGTVIEDAPARIKVTVDIKGIQAATEYDKAQILSIDKTGSAPDNPDPVKAPAPSPGQSGVSRSQPAASGPKIYNIELTGLFGVDISETPLRQAIKDAKRNEADYIIITLDNDWSLRRRGGMGERKDDEGEFDAFFRVEKLDPIYTEEIEREWTTQPQVIFWVKKAMGGAAFMPLSCPNIYFHPDGKMGGIGNMEKTVRSGDEVVRQKLLGARLGHVRGMANKGGYDPRIVRAMAETSYILSVKYVGGKPILLERMPESADEYLLTDDGDEDRKDGDEDLARGQGNDTLTLDADKAFKLGISKGTVSTLDDLIFKLGISRNHQVVKGQAANIMKGWRDGIEYARRRLPKLWEQYGEVPPGANYQERSQSRARRLAIIREMQSIIKKYEEAFNPRAVGVPDFNELEIMKKQIEFEAMRDKPEKKP
jgi:hypothetical protein